MSVIGLETEYGLLLTDHQQLSQEDAALTLLHYCPIVPKVPFSVVGESPRQDARQPQQSEQQSQLHLSPGDAVGFMLGNGARLYVDHGHPEYATPECSDALAIVASDKAGELIMERCRQQVNRFLPPGQAMRLFKNNSDHQGHSYGCHENYLLSATLYQKLFQKQSFILHAHLIPFLVSRQVVCGAGKVGSENGSPPVNYQISQRSDFFETIVGLQTMSHRPIINTRDEPHADAKRWRRLHVILGDANMAELSTYLKVSTTQLLLRMLEANVALPDLTLQDPLAALVQISHDPTCKQKVLLADGQCLTAVAIQQHFAEAAQQYADTQPQVNTGLTEWITVLQKLKEDPLLLADSLDWVIKWQFLRDWQSRKQIPWSSAELKELDIRYHDINREKSLFYLLASSAKIRSIVPESLVEKAVLQPLSPTRASQRAAAIKKYGDQIQSASWTTITIYKNAEKTKLAQQHLPNPLPETVASH